MFIPSVLSEEVSFQSVNKPETLYLKKKKIQFELKKKI